MGGNEDKTQWPNKAGYSFMLSDLEAYTLRTPTEPQRGLGSTNHALLIQRHSLFKNIYLQKLYLTVTESFYLQKLYSIGIRYFVFFHLGSFVLFYPTHKILLQSP